MTTTTYELRPLIVGIFPAFPYNRFVHGAASAEPVRAPCLSWLASGSDGSLILVDTGPPAPTELTAPIHFGLEVRPEHRIDNALRVAGVDPALITTVVLTHLHFDHCGDGETLPNAEFLVQRRELQHAVSPEPAQCAGYEVGYPGVLPSWMRVFDRIRPLDGITEITPGAVVLPLPGHTPGSSGVVFTTAQGRVAAVGDLVNQRENWDAPGGGHAAPGMFCDLDDCYQSLARLEHVADSVLASHDFRSVPGYRA